MESVLANLTAAAVRRVTHEGREYFVAPMSLIVPGVLNGSKGALLYPHEQIQHDPGKWDHMPITVYHPTRNGENVSAWSQDILDRQGIGFTRNTEVNGKLRTEGWIDIEKCKKVDNRVYRSLEQGKPIELSTGLYTDNEQSSGTYNGKGYDFVATNYRPDHVAILPDQVGACSIDDGCGVLINRNGDFVINGGPGSGRRPEGRVSADKIEEHGRALAKLHNEKGWEAAADKHKEITKGMHPEDAQDVTKSYQRHVTRAVENVTGNTIRKVGGKYRLVSGSGKNLGEYDSREGAEKRERQVEYFKHADNCDEEEVENEDEEEEPVENADDDDEEEDEGEEDVDLDDPDFEGWGSDTEEGKAKKPVKNEFCATGEGGGVDPSCGKGGSGGGAATAEKEGGKKWHYPGSTPSKEGSTVRNFKESLGIPRSEMPQIKTKLQKDFVKWAIDKKGVKITKGTAGVDQLKPLQKEYDQARVDAMGGKEWAEKSKKPIFISKDNYVLDGTHHVMKHISEDPDKGIPILRIHLKARDAVKLMNGWKGTTHSGAEFAPAHNRESTMKANAKNPPRNDGRQTAKLTRTNPDDAVESDEADDHEDPNIEEGKEDMESEGAGGECEEVDKDQNAKRGKGIKGTNNMMNSHLTGAPHDASMNAGHASLRAHDPKSRAHAITAMDHSYDDNPKRAAYYHGKAAESHEDAATDARKEGDEQSASRHDEAASAHRKAASLHSATMNSKGGAMVLTKEKREEIIDLLATNCECENKDVLNKLSDKKLLGLKGALKTWLSENAKAEGSNADATGSGTSQAGGKGTKEEYKLSGNAPKDDDDEDDEDDDEDEERTRNSRTQVQNTIVLDGKKYKASDLLSMIDDHKTREAKERQVLIGALTANSEGDEKTAAVAWLETKPTKELRAMVKLIPTQNRDHREQPANNDPVALYLGAVGGPIGPQVVTNADREDYLPLPTMDYEEIRKEQSVA